MSMRWFGIVLSLAILGLCFVPSAPEAAIFLSGPTEGNSWSFSLGQSASEVWLGDLVGSFDNAQAYWVSGSTFEVPLFQNMSGGWTAGAVGQTATFGSAAGPSVDFSFDLVFNDPIQNTTFQYFLYNGNTLKQAQEITVGPNGYFSSFDLSPNPVPEPASLLLLGLGLLGGLGPARRRLRR